MIAFKTKLIPGLRIRRLRPEDAQALSYIETAIFPTPWNENSLRSCLELANVEGETVVLEEQIVGYFFAQYAEEEAHILNIGVIEDYRRRGIASVLLERFLAIAKERGMCSCFLEVRTGNLGAQKMYFKHGFIPTYVRKGYYPGGEDALILMKRLKD